MNYKFIKFLLSTIFIFNFFTAFSTDYKTIDLKPSDKIIKNSHIGFCFMPNLDSADKVPDWVLNTSSIVYFRLDWADVIDKNGNYIFEQLDDKVFSTYRKRGLKIAFRIIAASIHSDKKNVFPRAILGKNIPFVKITSVYGKEQEEPVFWDENYLKEHERLMQELGKYIAKHSDVDFIDLGGMGEWGEMHLDSWSVAQLEQYGFSQEVYINAVFKMMDQMERYLPNITKAICVSATDSRMENVIRIIVDRAIKHGWWLRTDGYSKEGLPSYVKPYFDKHFTQTGFIMEPASTAINRDYAGGIVPVKYYFDTVFGNHPSIFNLMGYNEKFVYVDTVSLSGNEKNIAKIFELSKNNYPAALNVHDGIKIEKSENGYTINGTEKNEWEYVIASNPSIKHNCIYVMKVKLRAWKGDIQDSRICFKFGIHKKNWEWIKNINADYDFTKEGTWQEFYIEYQPQGREEELLVYAIEKKRKSPSSINAEIEYWTVEEIELPPD